MLKNSKLVLRHIFLRLHENYATIEIIYWLNYSMNRYICEIALIGGQIPRGIYYSKSGNVIFFYQLNCN